jgi:hypothetical protein
MTVQLLEAEEQEVLNPDTGIAEDRRSGMPLGKLEVSILGAHHLPLHSQTPRGGSGSSAPRSRRLDAYVRLTIDPITFCLGRTGAFGSHPAGSYLFRTAAWGAEGEPRWNEKFVIKPILRRQAVLRLTAMGTNRWVGG